MKYNSKGFPIGLDDFELLPSFIENNDANEYFSRLKKEIPWEETMWKTGRKLPRLTFAYNRNQKTYPVLEELINHIELVFETTIFSLWGNLYRSGNDYTPYHQDSYGNAHAYTLSFGDTRKFILQKISDKSRKEFFLKNGDLFYFSPETNLVYKHSIPRTKKSGERISIVFFGCAPYSSSKEEIPLGDILNSIVSPDEATNLIYDILTK